MLAFHPPDGVRRLRAALRRPVLARQAMPFTLHKVAEDLHTRKDLMYVLKNVGVGQSQRHKLMSFMDDASTKLTGKLFTWPLTLLPSAIAALTPTTKSA